MHISDVKVRRCVLDVLLEVCPPLICLMYATSINNPVLHVTMRGDSYPTQPRAPASLQPYKPNFYKVELFCR